MGVSDFSIFTAFKAKDGVSPVFKSIIKNSNSASLSIASGMSRAKMAVIGLKTACTTVATAIAAIGAFVPLKAFSDWEKGLITVYTLLSKDEIKHFGGTLKDLSKEGIRAGLSVEDVNKALFNSVSAMGMSNKTIDIYKNSLILAKGGVADLSTSVSGMMAVINAWGNEATTATNVANAFFTAQKRGVTTVEELASSIGTVAPLAKSMGLSVEETLATMAALTKGGLSTDMAATGLRSTLAALSKPSKEAEETLKKFGVPVGIAEVKAKGLTYTLQKLIELQKKSPNAITKAIPNIKALTGVLAIDELKMKEVHNTLEEIQKDIKNGTGLNEAFDMMNTTSAATMARVTGELQVALIELGEIVAPYLLPLVKTFGDMVHKFGELLPNVQIALNTFNKFGNTISTLYHFIKNNWLPLLLTMPAAIVGVKFAIDLLRLKMALLKMEFVSSGLGTWLATITSGLKLQIPKVLAWNAAWLANPITWIVLSVTALIGVIILLWKNWDKVSLAVSIFWGKTKSILSELSDKCKTIFTSIGSFIKSYFIDILFSALNPIAAIVSGLKNIFQLFGSVKSGNNLFNGDFKLGLNKDITHTPLVKNDSIPKTNNVSGVIEVKNIIENKNNSKISSFIDLESPNNLSLNPI